MSQMIYVIKTFQRASMGSVPYLAGAENVGFFFKQEDAIKAITSNSCDIHEGSGKYAVILSICEGLYNPCMPKDEIWFG